VRNAVRKILIGLAILLVLAVVAAAGVATWAARRPVPQASGTLALDVLDGPVDVYRDGFGVPHVYADTAHDLFVAQGFVHAQDRFWEMDVRRHSTAGRLSELFGESQVETDRFIRTMGWRRVAEQEWPLLSAETQQMFRDYAEGVNAYLQGRTPEQLSLEYAVLGLQRPGYFPEPWTPVDSLAWLKAMAWDLRSNTEDEISRVELTETLSVAQVEELWPPFPFDLRDPIVPNAGGAIGAAEAGGAEAAGAEAAGAEGTGAEGATGSGGGGASRGGGDAGGGGERETRSEGRTGRGARPLLAQLADDLADLPAMLGPSGSGLGSNSFVVAGDKTTTGLPLLANDPHLAPALPSIWYQMALHCRSVSDACPYAVTGVTFAGMPGVIIGHNERIAWGFTNLGPDVADLVLERIDGDNYEYAGRSLPLEQRTETIRVAGGDDVTVTVRETGHGPLLSDASQELQTTGNRAPAATASEAGETQPPAGGNGPAGGDIAVAMRWTALRPGRTADAIVALNRATNWDEFRAAASLFEVPSQNIVYADVDGNIGYQAPGRIPLRARGDDGRWPVAGWTGANDWQGYVAFDDLPSLFNPAEGFIVTANQPVIAEDAGPFLSRDHDYGWRSQRLRDLLSEARDLEPADLLSIQTDAHSGIAEVLVPLLTTVEVPEDVEPARDLLDNWDLQQNVDSAAGAYFAGVWRHLLERTFADDLPARTDIAGNDRWMEVVRRLVGDPDAQWWDDASTDQREGRDDMLRAALVDAHTELSERLGDDPAQWRWGELHTLQMRHMTLGSSGIPAIEWMFNRGSVQVGGSTDAVDATGWDASAGYEVDWVPSMRMVVDLFDWDASRWINLTGASGHAFTTHYTDQVERWATGGSAPMRWSPPAVRAAAADHLVLAPSSAEGE
jgi:penicillin amidase